MAAPVAATRTRWVSACAFVWTTVAFIRAGVFACPGYNRLPGKHARFDLPVTEASGGAYGYNFSETYWGIPNHQCRGLDGFTSDRSGIGTPMKESQVASPSSMNLALLGTSTSHF